jgi:hypothetical protein
MSGTIELSPLVRHSRRRLTEQPVARAIHAPWSDEPMLLLDDGVPYMITPEERDPVRRSEGRHTIPARQITLLRDHAEAGARFDRIALVHELDPFGPVADLLPVLRRGPVTCSQQVAEAVVSPIPDHPVVARVARVVDRVAGLISSGAGGLESVLRESADLALDPIVFGVVGIGAAPRQGVTARWYPLAAWRW